MRHPYLAIAVKPRLVVTCLIAEGLMWWPHFVLMELGGDFSRGVAEGGGSCSLQRGLIIGFWAAFGAAVLMTTWWRMARNKTLI